MFRKDFLKILLTEAGFRRTGHLESGQLSALDDEASNILHAHPRRHLPIPPVLPKRRRSCSSRCLNMTSQTGCTLLNPNAGVARGRNCKTAARICDITQRES